MLWLTGDKEKIEALLIEVSETRGNKYSIDLSGLGDVKVILTDLMLLHFN